jgi:DNA-binding transcriptional regulator YiaG
MSGKNLKLTRIRYEIPQWRLAQAMRITPSLLSAWENERVPMPEEKEKLYLKKLNELRKEQESWRSSYFILDSKSSN